nr:hypothetical protein CFP56_52275 [Quercus suber]
MQFLDEPWFEAVKDVRTRSTQLKEQLRLDPESQRGLEELGLATKQPAYMKLVSNIEQGLSTSVSLAMHSQTPPENLPICLPDFRQRQAYASRIFHALDRSLYRSCQAAHKLSICLESFDRTTLPFKELSCRVIIHHASTSTEKGFPWSLVEVELRLKKTVVNPAIAKGSPLGYLVDADMSQYELYRPKDPLFNINSCSAVSLAEVLATEDGTTFEQLSNDISRRLAPALALGMLRLYGTPWLSKPWTCADIMLSRQDGMLVRQYPLFSVDLKAPSDLQQRHQTSAIRFPPNSHGSTSRRDTVFALGLLLIELCMKAPFHEVLEDASAIDPDGTRHIASKLMTTRDVLRRVHEECDELYSDAVRSCILGRAGTGQRRAEVSWADVVEVEDDPQQSPDRRSRDLASDHGGREDGRVGRDARREALRPNNMAFDSMAVEQARGMEFRVSRGKVVEATPWNVDGPVCSHPGLHTLRSIATIFYHERPSQACSGRAGKDSIRTQIRPKCTSSELSFA